LAALKQEVIDLASVRTDGWFEQLAAEIPEFAQLCELLGQRFVAFSFIAGVRVTAVAYDPQAPDSSLVDFESGGGSDGDVSVDVGVSDRLSLSDFRERLGELLTSQDQDLELDVDVQVAALRDGSDVDDLRACIGRRYLLLAPVFGIHLATLQVLEGEPMVEVDLGHARETISVQGLREILDGAVRAEIARARPAAPFSIDFKRIPLAEQANDRGDFDETVSLLGSWPGPLSMFLRTPQGQGLGPSERGRLVKALGLLGQAYLQKQQAEWAEDVLRLGIQFGQELDAAGPLFGWLGRVRVDTGRYGEAIGLLRRALSLGGDQAVLNADLARCFFERKRFVAALACLDAAHAAGDTSEPSQSLRTRIKAVLGDAYLGYGALFDAPPS
jgi:tetratricopeptide (TPR) repeat protein